MIFKLEKKIRQIADIDVNHFTFLKLNFPTTTSTEEEVDTPIKIHRISGSLS